MSKWLNDGTGADIGTATFENDQVANALRNADAVGQARDYWYNMGNMGKKTIYNGVTNFQGEERIGGGNFGFKGIYKAGLDPIEQYIGGYRWDATVIGNKLQFTISNRTSLRSAAYHLWPEKWNPTKGPMGNFYQIYTFREPLRK